MMVNRHLSDRELVLAMDGELSRTRRVRVSAHLDGCPACRMRLERAALTFADFVDVHRDEAPATRAAHRDLRTRLQTRMIETAGPLRSEAGQWWRGGFRTPAVAWIGAAATVVVLVLPIVVLDRAGRAPRAAAADVEPGSLPVARFTPGATRPVTLTELCDGRERPSETIDDSVRRAVLLDYRMADVPSHEYELDYLITPELGGSADRENLWPERYTSRTWNARVKDELEEMLPRLVCKGNVSLAAAQRDIATDWIAAYKKYFRTERPLGVRQLSRLTSGPGNLLLAMQARADATPDAWTRLSLSFKESRP